jgi:hypothetical protein
VFVRLHRVLVSHLAVIHRRISVLTILLVRQSGLVPYGDYVVGWTEGPLYSESEFYDLVEQVRRRFSLRFGEKTLTDRLCIAC